VGKKEAERFLATVLGEPAKSLGSLVALPLKKRLHRNLIKAAVEAKQLLANAGLSPQEVPLNIIHPAIQANAADPRQLNPVHLSFPVILKELTGSEVRFLDAVYAVAEAAPPRSTAGMRIFTPGSLQGIYD
jgi:hypothetical protein